MKQMCLTVEKIEPSGLGRYKLSGYIELSQSELINISKQLDNSVMQVGVKDAE